jgi:hypothetical protein
LLNSFTKQKIASFSMFYEVLLDWRMNVRKVISLAIH